MIKPLVDDRKYRVIKLTNNLEVLMISDVSTSRCSSSMSVGVGSFQDDDDILGLAHFTEHMIFLVLYYNIFELLRYIKRFVNNLKVFLKACSI